MAGVGSGYDLSVSTFSPDGRVFQVEYASKAVESSATCLAFICADGVVLGSQRPILSKLMVKSSMSRIHIVDRHIIVAVSGLFADSRQIINRARDEAANYKKVYGELIPGRVLAERVAHFLHAYTLAWSVRPFGAAALIATTNKDHKMEIYCVDPAGTCYRHAGTALGQGRQTAKTEIEKLDLSSLTCDEAVFHVVKILLQSQDESRERKFDFQLGWMGPQSGYLPQIVADRVVQEATERAQRHLEQMEE